MNPHNDVSKENRLSPYLAQLVYFSSMSEEAFSKELPQKADSIDSLLQSIRANLVYYPDLKNQIQPNKWRIKIIKYRVKAADTIDESQKSKLIAEIKQNLLLLKKE